jgi:hypothetical protein
MLNLSTSNAHKEGSRGMMIVAVQVGAVKIYVASSSSGAAQEKRNELREEGNK